VPVPIAHRMIAPGEERDLRGPADRQPGERNRGLDRVTAQRHRAGHRVGCRPLLDRDGTTSDDGQYDDRGDRDGRQPEAFVRIAVTP
jgi:hypothetical protein